MKNPYTHLQISMKEFLNISAYKTEPFSVQGRKWTLFPTPPLFSQRVLGQIVEEYILPFKGKP